MDRAPLVDFCNQRNPRAHPQDRLSPVFTGSAASPVHPALPARACRPRSTLCRRRPEPRSAAGTTTSRGLTGQGPACFRCRRVSSSPLRAALSSNERSTPTRSARTPPVMEPWQRRVETPTVPGAPPVRERHRDDPTTRARPVKGWCSRAFDDPPARYPFAQARSHRRIGGRGPLHPFSREEVRDPPHPRCLSSVSVPTDGRSRRR
jgi:hypothetical protein